MPRGTKRKVIDKEGNTSGNLVNEIGSTSKCKMGQMRTRSVTKRKLGQLPGMPKSKQTEVRKGEPTAKVNKLSLETGNNNNAVIAQDFELPKSILDNNVRKVILKDQSGSSLKSAKSPMCEDKTKTKQKQNKFLSPSMVRMTKNLTILIG